MESRNGGHLQSWADIYTSLKNCVMCAISDKMYTTHRSIFTYKTWSQTNIQKMETNSNCSPRLQAKLLVAVRSVIIGHEGQKYGC